MNITFREATIEDIELLEYWEEQPHVAASGVEDWDWEEDFAENDPAREPLIAELDGRPIGFVDIQDPFLERSHYWGDVEPNLRAIDIWIGEPDCLGKGYGTEMMRLALERCFAEPKVTAVIIDPLASNTDAIRFYERLGFKFVERRVFDEDDCAIHKLERGDWEKLI